MWLTVDINGETMVAGWVAIEVILLVPLVFGARRVNKLSSLIARADSSSEEDQRAEADALRSTDEALSSAAGIVASIDRGPARSRADAALAAAERAAIQLRMLVRRRTQLKRLLVASRSPTATATVHTTLRALEEDVERLESQIAEITASIAVLVDAVGGTMLEQELEHLRRTTDDVSALVSALEEIAAMEKAAGLGRV